MSNLQTVQEIYGAFAQGDVAAVAERCADDVDWEYGESSTDVPWLQRTQGKEGAMKSMASQTAIETHSFMPTVFLEGDDVVVVLFDTEFTVKETGKQVAEESAAHIWHFNNEGKVSRFRHRVDTHLQQMAYAG